LIFDMMPRLVVPPGDTSLFGGTEADDETTLREEDLGDKRDIVLVNICRVDHMGENLGDRLLLSLLLCCMASWRGSIGAFPSRDGTINAGLLPILRLEGFWSGLRCMEGRALCDRNNAPLFPDDDGGGPACSTLPASDGTATLGEAR
jgi:hypothetical protein